MFADFNWWQTAIVIHLFLGLLVGVGFLFNTIQIAIQRRYWHSGLFLLFWFVPLIIVFGIVSFICTMILLSDDDEDEEEEIRMATGG